MLGRIFHEICCTNVFESDGHNLHTGKIRKGLVPAWLFSSLLPDVQTIHIGWIERWAECTMNHQNEHLVATEQQKNAIQYIWGTSKENTKIPKSKTVVPHGAMTATVRCRAIAFAWKPRKPTRLSYIVKERKQTNHVAVK